MAEDDVCRECQLEVAQHLVDLRSSPSAKLAQQVWDVCTDEVLDELALLVEEAWAGARDGGYEEEAALLLAATRHLQEASMALYVLEK